MKSPPELILASTSKYRRELLARLGKPFRCVAPGVEETAQPGERPTALVARLAGAKARAVAAHHPTAYVIGSDQVAVRVDPAGGEVILGKPGSVADCLEQLRNCSGQSVSFLTAVTLMQGERVLSEFTDTTRVTFRILEADSIERYVAEDNPLDCAGGFKSEALGICLCESVSSTDPTALIGLPLIRLAGMLRSEGFELP